MIEETDLLEMFFGIRDGKPIIGISDDDKTVATFSCQSAYEQGRVFWRTRNTGKVVTGY